MQVSSSFKHGYQALGIPPLSAPTSYGGQMKKLFWTAASALLLAALLATLLAADKVDSKNINTGKNAFADSASLKPGQARKLTPADLPKPFATKSATNFPRVAPRPTDAWPQAPAG